MPLFYTAFPLLNLGAYFLLTGIVEILNPIKDQFHTELAQKLTATDSLLKDSISKLVRSKVSILSCDMRKTFKLVTNL